MKRITRRHLYLAIPALLLACSNGGDNVSVVKPADNLSNGLSTITRQSLQRHLNFLTDDARLGRMTGTQGHEESADYVAQQFAMLGLEPAGDDGWFQQVPFISNMIDTRHSGVIVHLDDGDTALRWKQDYVMGGDKVRAQTRVRAEVVYVGYGIHAPEANYSDYDGVDVSGKIVALFGGAPSSFAHNERAFYSSGRTKRDEMARRGAVGWIGMRSRVSQKRMTWDRIKLNAGLRPGMSWLNLSGDAADYVAAIEAGATINVSSATQLFDGTLISFEEALDAAEAGKSRSTPLGIEVTIRQRSSHEQITSPNVIGVLRGSDPELADEYVIYSAHLDHLGTGAEVNGDKIYNGFYDNAMGVSLLIEAARAFAAMPEAPRRSILFIAVTGEERGLLGSDYFAHYPTVPADAMVANVNLDMPLLLFPIADIIAFGAEHSSLEAQIKTAVALEGFALSPDPMPEEVIFVRSDQYSFVRQGVPSVFLVPGFNSTDPDIDGAAIVTHHRRTHYHRPSDDNTRPVDWRSALRFARANVRVGHTVAMDDARPTWNEDDFFGDRFAADRRDSSTVTR
jgi:Zn-dependent M28 family amino/carboxypeptidase